MKIETKFDYFSTVFTMLDNKVYSFDVEKIEVYISPKDYGDKYSPMKVAVVYYDYMCRNRFDEKDCYAKTDESKHEFVCMTVSRDYNKPRDGEPPFLAPICSAPYLWQAQKWLRERKKLHCQVLLNGVRSMYFWQVRELVGNGKHAESKHQYETYEDAMNDCIAAALELIEEKGE